MKVLVCGGRTYGWPAPGKDPQLVREERAHIYDVLDVLHKRRGFEMVITGGAAGADLTAVTWARERGVKRKVVPADWEAFGKAAGVIRNQKMLDEEWPDLVVAFPGRTGTAAHMVRIAEAAGVEILIG